MAESKAFLEALASGNSNLTSEINQLVIDLRIHILPQDEVDRKIKALLLKVYDSIAMLRGHPRHPDVFNEDVFPVWRSFLEPISALFQLPSGHFLSARMILYLSSGLLEQRSLALRFHSSTHERETRPLFRLCNAIDDALLARLRSIWTASNESERFDWVFAPYSLPLEDSSEEGTSRCREIAQALTPEELTAMGGIEGRRFIWAMSADEREGDVKEWKSFRGGLPGDAAERAKYSVPDDDRVKPGQCFWKQIGSDGPIRGKCHYYCTNRRSPHMRTSFHRWDIQLLGRSRHFVIDARRLTEQCLTEGKSAIVHDALIKVNMPPEIRQKIINYLEFPRKHPYLRHLDIAKAYAPFPERERLCERCLQPSTTERERLTCPESTFFAWNFALRAFIAYHQHSVQVAALCKHGLDCKGHHDEDGWEIENEETFSRFIEGIVKERCSSDTTLDQVGLGPNKEIATMSDEEAREQEQKLLQIRGPLEDTAAEMTSSGGFCGLVHSMLHGRIFIGSSPSRGNHPAKWGVGRDFAEYLKAIRRVWALRPDDTRTWR